MTVVMRNYNGVYSVFIETKGEKELVYSSKILVEAEKACNVFKNKIEKLK